MRSLFIARVEKFVFYGHPPGSNYELLHSLHSFNPVIYGLLIGTTPPVIMTNGRKPDDLPGQGPERGRIERGQQRRVVPGRGKQNRRPVEHSRRRIDRASCDRRRRHRVTTQAGGNRRWRLRGRFRNGWPPWWRFPGTGGTCTSVLLFRGHFDRI